MTCELACHMKMMEITRFFLLCYFLRFANASLSSGVTDTSTAIQHCKKWTTNYTGNIYSVDNLFISSHLRSLHWTLNQKDIASCACKDYTCAGEQSNFPYNVTCAGDKTKKSYVTVLSSQPGLISIASCTKLTMRVGVKSYHLNETFTVSNCPDALMWSVKILSSTYNYMSEGKFYCDHGGELFYSNGSRRNSYLTHCLKHATWSGQENLQCWTAPVIELNPSTISGTEGTCITICCNETRQEFPFSQYYNFYFGTDSIRSNNSHAQICLKREWHGKRAYCEAVSDYTILSQNSSLSNHSNVTVYSRLLQLNPSVIVGKEGSYVDIFCNETGQGFPLSERYSFYIDRKKIFTFNVSSRRIVLKREWNGKAAHCEVSSAYLKTMNKTVKSGISNIVVFYDPYISEQPNTCTLYLSGGNSPCKVKFHSNPLASTFIITKDGLLITNDQPVPIQHGVYGLHTFVFSKNQVSKSDAGLYTLSVESGLNSGKVDKRLVVNFTVLVEQAPPAPEANIALIAGASAVGVVVIILIIVIVVIILKRRKQDKEGEKSHPSSAPSPVVYCNVSAKEAEEIHGQSRENQAITYEQPIPVACENVHHYEVVGTNTHKGDDDPYIDLNI